MTPASITQWLQEPDQNTEPTALRDMLERYPYFMPLHYMATAGKQEAGGELKLADHAVLYQGNWLLFHQIIRDAANAEQKKVESSRINVNEAPAILPQASTVPETIVKTPTETQDISPITDPVPATEDAMNKEEASIIQPVFTEDYFLHQGVPVADNIPEELDAAHKEPPVEVAETTPQDPKSLMVVMSFTDWLMHFKSKTQKEKEEEDDRKAVKHMWQREKLAAALEEEDDEIPENVFEMAVNSISKEDGLVSESLAEILAKQGKWDKAIEMYRKLSLRNPQKSTYFAQQIAAIQKKSE